jgi:DNA-binding NarL/FixJ family response regulator
MTDDIQSGCKSPCWLRVLLVENDTTLREQYTNLLRNWNYIPVVAQGIGTSLLKDAEQKDEKYRCHVALVDLHLIEDGNFRDWSGLELVSKLRSKWSHLEPDRKLQRPLPIIITSAGDMDSMRETHEEYHVLRFVEKQKGSGVIRAAIEEAAKLLFACSHHAQITWLPDLSSAKITRQLFPEHQDVPDDEPDDLVGLLFPEDQRIILTMPTDTVNPSNHEPNLCRRSRVFYARKDDQPAWFVVKLGHVDKIQREIKNYRDYVDFGLISQFRPMLIAKALLWDIGAVAYNLLGNQGINAPEGPKAFTAFYQETDDASRIMKPLSHFFDLKNWGNYFHNDVRPLGKSLFDAYNQAWSGALQAELSHWRTHDQQRFFPSLPTALPNPTYWLSVHYQRCAEISARQAVTHGDLHGDNLFVDCDHAWPIDFERTGRGPILRDFVELIQDILTRLANFTEDELPVLYDLAVVLCEPRAPGERIRLTPTIANHPVAHKAFLVVEALQKLAYKQTRYQDRREYLWGLLFNNLFVVTMLPETDLRRTRTLLLAGVICSRLDYWDRSPWPLVAPSLQGEIHPDPPNVSKRSNGSGQADWKLSPTLPDASNQSSLPTLIGIRPSAIEAVTLTLRFVMLGKSVQISWECDEVGHYTSTFRPPYDTATLPLVVKALNAIQYPTYPTEGPRFEQVERDQLVKLGLWQNDRVAIDIDRRVGRALYDRLLTDNAAEVALSGVRNAAIANARPLTYLLRFPPNAVELAALPWELLRDNTNPLVLSRGQLASFVRYLDLEQALPPPYTPGKMLRILAIAPNSDIPLEVRAEERQARNNAWAKLQAEGAVALEELSPAKIADLVDRIQSGPPVDIVHFYGHGRYENRQGELLFDAPGGGKTWIGADKLAALLGQTRLVMLHACKSAMIGEAGLVTGVASALTAAGVPMVVAMQLVVQMDAATRFAGIVYNDLARGQSIQEAVSRARQALYVESADGASWYVPTLMIRSRNTEPMRLIQPA